MNLFELFATISLDSSSYEAGLENAEKNANSAGSKIGNAISTIAKVSTAAVGAAAAGVTAITKSAVNSYADYEQLVGGIETLFGSAAGAVIADADAAFKTAGVSANEYMETSIQSAAALINSLGGNQKKAAKLMNMSITDMADNVNKMGTSMEAVQNAYRGFSRGNFTMLDNLALGFAGTKEGMEELLATANKISGVKYNIKSYSDIVEAIHVVQKEMGISGITAEEAAEAVRSGALTQEEAYKKMGTTAKEAMTTISGSTKAMKSAWRNLVTGLANNDANIDGLVGSLVSSLETMIDNIAPAVERFIKSIGPAVQKATPMLVKAFTGLASSVLPSIVGVAGELISSLSKAFSDNAKDIAKAGADLLIILGEGIIENLPLMLETGLSIIKTLGQSLIDNLPAITESIIQLISDLTAILTDPETIGQLMIAVVTIMQTIGTSIIENIPALIAIVMQVLNNVTSFITDNLPMFIDAALKMISTLGDGLVQAIPELVRRVPIIINDLTQALLDFLPTLVSTGTNLLTALVTNLPDIIKVIVDAVHTIVLSITSNLELLIPQIVDAGITLFTALVDALPQIVTNIVDATPKIVGAIVEGFNRLLPKLGEAGVKLFTAIIDNLPTILYQVGRAVLEILKSIYEGIGNAIPTMLQVGGQLIQGLWQGISNVGEWLREKISGFFGGVVQSIKNFFGIKSPSKVFAGIGEMLDRGLAKGIGDYADMAVDAAESMAEDVFGATDRDFNFTATGDAYGSDATVRRGVVINVYGAEGQDVNELAEVISQKIAFGYAQEQAVWA